MIGLAGTWNPQGAGYREALIGLAGMDISGMRFLERAGLTPKAQPNKLADLAGGAATASPHVRVADTLAARGVQRVNFFLDFPNAVKPVASDPTQLEWQAGRAAVFGREVRMRPIMLDCAGYGRAIALSAPKWAHKQETYHAAVELVQPDDYIAFDHPGADHINRIKTFDALDEMQRTFPRDTTPHAERRMWPVWSVRWGWDDGATLHLDQLPQFARRDLVGLVPITPGVLRPRDEKLKEAARFAIANALMVALDPDFQRLCGQFGRIALGGMVHGPIARPVRHLYVGVLSALYPDVRFWLLGQASSVVVNGLAHTGLLDRVGCDGTTYLHDARAEVFYFLNGEGRIGTFHFGQGQGMNARLTQQSMFSLSEMMVANVRALVAAYEGVVNWPTPLTLPVDVTDRDAMAEVLARYRAEIGMEEDGVEARELVGVG